MAGRHQCGYLTGRFQGTAVFDGADPHDRSPGMHSSWPNIPAVVISTGRGQAGRLYLERPGGRFGPERRLYWAGAFRGDLVVGGRRGDEFGGGEPFLTRFSARTVICQWLRHLRERTSSSVRTLCLDRFGNLLLAGVHR